MATMITSLALLPVAWWHASNTQCRFLDVACGQNGPLFGSLHCVQAASKEKNVAAAAAAAVAPAHALSEVGQLTSASYR